MARHPARAPRPKLELADILRAHLDELGPISRHRNRTVQALLACRTARLGGHVLQCDVCGEDESSYNSCRNRHCPKCQSLDAQRWVEAQEALLLPIRYHHVVFTVPEQLHPLFLAAPKAAYGLLFEAVAETLTDVARRPRNLGARIGFTAVLHTWNQVLGFHPHLHCIVTGGGLSADGEQWIPARARFLFSVKVLGLLFRAKLLKRFERAVARGDVPFARNAAEQLLRKAARKPWNVYSKPTFARPEQVLRYLSRYTHRIAISNHRLVELRDGRVTFHYRDRANGNCRRQMTLLAAEFLRRFLLHVLPPGFQRIRHFGLLANGRKKVSLACCRRLLNVPIEASDDRDEHETWYAIHERVTGTRPRRCSRCGLGVLRELRILPPVRAHARAPPGVTMHA